VSICIDTLIEFHHSNRQMKRVKAYFMELKRGIMMSQ